MWYRGYERIIIMYCLSNNGKNCIFFQFLFIQDFLELMWWNPRIHSANCARSHVQMLALDTSDINVTLARWPWISCLAHFCGRRQHRCWQVYLFHGNGLLSSKHHSWHMQGLVNGCASSVCHLNYIPGQIQSFVLFMAHNICQSLPLSRCSITLLISGRIISHKKCHKRCFGKAHRGNSICKAVWGLRGQSRDSKESFWKTHLGNIFSISSMI